MGINEGALASSYGIGNVDLQILENFVLFSFYVNDFGA
jgi:hypothetical protein